MPAAAVTSTAHFRDTVALYSQHLARPPSVSHPAPESGRRGRRRPKSASAAIRRGDPRTLGLSATTAGTCKENSRAYTQSGQAVPFPLTTARPASAAAVSHARPLSTPTRPSRPRPVTATGMPSCPKRTHHHQQHLEGNSTHERKISLAQKNRRCRSAQERSLLSSAACPSHSARYPRASNKASATKQADRTFTRGAPPWRYDQKSGDATTAIAPRWEGPKTEGTCNAIAAADTGFWHEHDYLGTDSATMQSVTEFVTKIAGARAKEERDNDLLSPQSKTGPRTPASSVPAPCTENEKIDKGAMRIDSVADSKKNRPGWRQGSTDHQKAHASAATPRSGERSSPPKKASTRGTKKNYVHPRRRKTVGQSESMVLVPNINSPKFLSGSTEPDLDGDVVDDTGKRDGSCKDQHVQPARVWEGVTEDFEASSGNKEDVSTTEKRSPSLPMTPLTFDLFCSMRPTLRNRSRAPQNRSASAKGTGLPNSTKDSNSSHRSRPACQRGPPLGDNNFSCSAPTTLPVGDRGKDCTWTSVFGAVCAGAERGRARAEVLKAARRGSFRLRRRRKRAASPFAQLVPGVPASAPRVGEHRDTAEFLGDAMDEKSDEEASKMPSVSHTTEEVKTEAGKDVAGDEAPRGGSCEETNRDGADPLRLLDPTASGTVMGDRHESKESLLLCAIGDARLMPATGAVETGESSEGCREHTGDDTSARAHTKILTQHPAGTVATCPLFRRPFGGGATLIGVNMPRSIQVCPGERGFSGATLATSSSFFDSAQRRLGGEGRSCTSLSGWSSPRRPSTAGCIASPSVASSGGAGNGDNDDGRQALAGEGVGRRPDTARSCFSSRKQGKAWCFEPENSDRGSRRLQADGNSLRQRVDQIAESIAKSLQSRQSTKPSGDSWRWQQQLQLEDGGNEEEEENEEGEECTVTRNANEGASAVAHSTRTSSRPKPEEEEEQQQPTERSTVITADDAQDSQPPDLASLPAPVAVDPDPGTVNVVGSMVDARVAPPVEPGDLATSMRLESGASNAAASVDVDHEAVSMGWDKRLPLRPSSAPPERAELHGARAFDGRQTASSPGLMENAHKTERGVTPGVAESAASRAFQGCQDPDMPPAGMPDVVAGGSGKLPTHVGYPCVNQGAPSRTACRDGGGDDVHVDGRQNDAFGGGGTDGAGGREGGVVAAEELSGGNANAKHETESSSGNRGEFGILVAPENCVVGNRSFVSGTEPGPGAQATVGAGSTPEAAEIHESTAAIPDAVETPLDFRNATVKLKAMAAEASVAVDGHEKSWCVSKERAEILFNDLRFAAEEDAQQSGHGAASETRHRLQRIVIESGLANSRRVEKEAALEEVRRVLRQDTNMYAARSSASDRMLEAMRELENENDQCDLLQLLECRQSRSLLILQDRTERERDELRASCRRRREAAAVMDATLAEARHAQGRLLGHTKHTIERMACLAEYVSVVRRWSQAQLASKRRARTTSMSINHEFEKKSKASSLTHASLHELDAHLKKRVASPISAPARVASRTRICPVREKRGNVLAPTSTRQDYGDSSTKTTHNPNSTTTIANTTRSTIANATTTVADNDTEHTSGADLRTIPSSIETLLDATSQLRRLLTMIPPLRVPNHSSVEDENGSFELGET
ncbi:unnamed protein product [Ectocarpus sp. 4 AP-2014]